MSDLYVEITVDELTEQIKEEASNIVDLQIQGMNEEQAQVYLLKEIMYKLDIQKYFNK